MVEPVTPQSASTLHASSVGKLRLLATICSCLALAIGLLILISWHAHWTSILQIRSDQVPMQYNTAVCIILGGTSLLLIIWRGTGPAAFFGAGVFLLGGLTLIQYLTGLDLGINQLFFKSYITIGLRPPGQMAPLSASCFTFIGAALILMGLGRPSSTRLMAAGMFSCIVSMVACVALFGYVTGIEAGYGWGSYIRMAMPTAAAFLFLSVGMLAWAWQLAQQINFNFLRWLPVTASVTLMVMVAITSGVSFSQLKSSLSWRKHSYEVLAQAQLFLGTIFDSQRGMRGYVLTGQLSDLNTYQSGVNNAPAILGQLKVLVSDNTAQTARVKTVSTDLDAVLAYSSRLVVVRKTQGLQAAIQLESTGEGFSTVNRLVADLRAFTTAETFLLNQRTSVSEDNFRNTSRLLVFASALAAILLLLANVMASWEVDLRSKTEDKLKQLTNRFRLAVDAANMGVWDWNIRTNHVLWDDKMYEIYGIPKGKVINYQTWVNAVDRHDLTKAEDILHRVISDKREGSVEFRITRQDGAQRHVYAAEVPMLDAKGEVVRVVGVNIDITKRKQIERTLQESEERFRLIVDGVKDYALLMLDPKGYVVSWNVGAERIKGYKAEEIIGQHFSRFYPEEEVTAGHPDQKLQMALKEGRYEEEGWRVRKNGSRFLANVVITAIHDDEEKLLGFAKITRDITDRKRMEIALHDKNIELQNAAEAKNRFLANMSHELRTPLNGIIGFSELLVDELPGEINADQKEYLQDILNSSHHLLQLINDVLDLAKVEAGRMDLHPDKFSLPQAIEQVCSVAYPIIQKKKIQITTTIAPEIDKVVLDQQKLKQVLYNLLSNAVKFTDERGHVGITVAPLGTDRFTLAVSDTGIGIRPENIKRLFKEFEQLDEGTTRQYQGTGLGLALTRKILEMQGGSIEVTSEFGKGSTFTATLPLSMEGLTV